MVDKELLEAIGQMMDAQKRELSKMVDEKLNDAEQRITKNMVALIDAEFKPRFDLLAEGQQDILERLVPRSRVDDLEEEMKFLKSVIRQISEEVQALKKAN